MRSWLKRLALLGGCGVLMVAVLPVLFVAVLIGGRLLMILAGPVNIFNMTWSAPSAANLAGQYAAHDDGYAARNFPKGAAPRLLLQPDHTMEVVDLPQLDGWGEVEECTHNGTGTWQTSDNGVGVRLTLNISTVAPPRRPVKSCKPMSLAVFEVLGHGRPYRIWYNIGDPDEGMGLEFKQKD